MKPTLTGVLLAGAVAPVAAQNVDAAIERFATLSFRQRAAIVRTVERQLAGSTNPVLRRIAALRLEVDELPDAAAQPPIHDPEVWASEEHAAGRAPDRRRLAANDPLCAAARERFPRLPFLDGLRTEVVYDWQSGQVVRHPPLEYSDLFANRARGWAPGADHAVAAILAVLDQDDRQRELAAWFGHTYCDLEARAYAGITLYEAWFSGERVDVPDVDAIPFAWELLGRRGMRSPLSGEPRDRLYEDIRVAALEHRRYRTTLEAAAAAFVAAEPILPANYGRLIPRFHLLWQEFDDEPAALADRLAKSDRDDLIATLDGAVRSDLEASRLRERRGAELRRAEELVRSTALAALERFAGDH